MIFSSRVESTGFASLVNVRFSRTYLGFALLLVLSWAGSPLKAQLPVAAFTIDSTSITPFIPVGAFTVYVTNSSTGATLSTKYYLHVPGNFYLPYDSATTPVANPQLELRLNSQTPCTPVALTQVVANSFGTDTMTTLFNLGCNCMTAPPQYWISTVYSGNGNLFISANRTDNSMSSDILGGFSCPPQSGTCNTVVPGPGNYPICVYYYGGTCAQYICDTVTIPCGPAPSANFSASNNQGTVTFTNLVQNWPVGNSLWDFGDGNSSTAPNPIHTYLSTGNYLVCHTVSSACGTTTYCDSVFAGCLGPTAGYSASFNLLTASFSNSSSGTGLISFTWDFGDGNVSSLPSPSHTYAFPGTYTVCLVVTALCGVDSLCLPYNVSCAAPSAGFTSISNQLNCNFSNTSSGLGNLSFAWDFGTGASSSSPNPTYLFPSPGTYQVCLTVSDTCGQTTFCDSVSVSCPAPSASFTFQQSLGFVVLNGMASGQGPFSYAWDYGDGNIGTGSNSSHTYSANGSYLVCLTVSDVCGSTTTCDTVVISGLLGTESSQTLDFAVRPNPADQQLTIRMGQAPMQGFPVTLLDLQGRAIWAGFIGAGQSEFRLDVSGIAAGVYILEAEIWGERVCRKVMISRR